MIFISTANKLKLVLVAVFLLFSVASSASAASASPFVEPPVCGDDTNEFLIEEMGESRNSAQYDGAYGCTYSRENCLYRGEEDKFYSQGEYRNTDEPDEEVGRLKNDAEFCFKRSSDDFGTWWDQDFGDIDGDGNQETCNVNSLYGSLGVRWVNEEYVQEHPQAVTGGIDDDWNQYVEDTGAGDEYESLPEQDSWNFNSESPVDSGARPVGNDSIATLGFCAGDDGGEHMVTQQCRTNLCDTERNVIGVTEDPRGCVFEPSTLSTGYSIDGVSERKIYDPGDQLDVGLGFDTQTIACFNNHWYEDWPIVFNQEVTQVPFGDSTMVGFEVINVRKERTTFNVQMIDPLTDDPSAYQHSQFVEEDGNSFEVSLPPGSSKTFHVEIQGATKEIDGTESEHDLRVRANAVNSDMSGEDYTTVEVVNNTATNSSLRTSEPQSVPGVGPLHIIVLMMLSSAVFYLQS